MIPVIDKKHIVLGVTGSIACYKVLDLASKLTQGGAMLNVVMTPNATRFVKPLAFSSITHRPVVTDLFNRHSELSMEHISLAEMADLVVVAPATANSIAKIALGLADEPLTTILLATVAPVIVVPAMDGHMYENAAVQENLNKLRRRGVTIVGPNEGHLASGKTGKGRMVEAYELMGHIRAILGKNGDLTGSTLVVTAGGTQERLDPARIITNRSSGKMGYALAEAARDRGARTILVTAPTSLPDPVAVEVVKVQTALEMRDQVRKATAYAQALVMAAAVTDYRPQLDSPEKLKKDSPSMTLELTRNPDILTELTGPIVKVGFAAESQDLTENAREKMARKSLDLIVANNITDPESGFGSDNNKVLILGENGQVDDLPLMPKEAVANRILDKVRDLMVTKRLQ